MARRVGVARQAESARRSVCAQLVCAARPHMIRKGRGSGAHWAAPEAHSRHVRCGAPRKTDMVLLVAQTDVHTQAR